MLPVTRSTAIVNIQQGKKNLLIYLKHDDALNHFGYSEVHTFVFPPHDHLYLNFNFFFPSNFEIHETTH